MHQDETKKKSSPFSWISLFLGSCGSAKNAEASARRRRSRATKQVSTTRLSFSDFSESVSPDDLSVSLAGSNLHVFTLAELKEVTQNFSTSNFVGEGGFGPVYKGFVDEKLRHGLKPQAVAVKLLDLDGLQGHKEWMAEVIFLGQLRHPHLVKLIGYCYEDEHRLLVYQFMTRGSLESHLFKRYLASLSWKARMKIALGAAKGLAFLHEAEQPVIYRDFKASNILLDSDYNAKLSDFGLATDGPQGDDTHVSTCVMGTQGYAAPEYIMTGHLTAKSDVFSFGVVLLELLTGRRSVDKNRSSREQNLVEWAKPYLNNPKKLCRIMDPSLEGRYSSEAAQKAAALAYRCLSHSQKSRPRMKAVIEILEPIQDLDIDTTAAIFVYVVEEDNVKEDYERNVAPPKEKENKPRRNHRQHGHRRRARSLKSSYSDTVLYKNTQRQLSTRQ